MHATFRQHWFGMSFGAFLLAGAGFAVSQPSVVGSWFLETSRQAGFVLNQLDLTGYSRTKREDILAVLDIDSGMPLLGIDLIALKDRIESLPWVKTANITRHLPSNLRIEVMERTPYALWQNERHIQLIDPEGVVITDRGLTEFSDLLRIIGKTAPEDLPSLLSTLGSEPLLASQVETAVRISERRWDLIFKNGIRLKLPDDSSVEYDSADAWTKFAEMNAEHNLLAREVSVIDMRLTDRVIMRVTPAGRRMMEGREWVT